ncbi:MAG: thiamine pyrophosphate-binding protein, partial [Spirochaetaceae bacterium]|nr:thiamine pyrophosphate-binding protein [Spirochaetaceae bacterium]
MRPTATVRNRLWAELIVDELARCGCRAAWVCPGARSAPLAAAAVRSAEVSTSICIDERAAGYQAVNAARASGAPAAVICTSGTAAANLLPAAVEAAMSGAPLLLLTADRPPELRDTGANQTIDQPDLFGRAVAWRFDLPVPDDRIDPAALLTTVDQAVHRARSAAAAVHLNCMFAEPLLDGEPAESID